MPKFDEALFTVILLIDHPPYFSLTGRFIEEDLAPNVTYLLTYDPSLAAVLYQDAASWAKFSHGSLSSIKTVRSKHSFSMSMPIILADEPSGVKTGNEPGSTKKLPADFFLTQALRLFWGMARLSQERRMEHTPFIINLAIKHPPFLAITSQFILDDEETHIQHLLTCHREYGQGIYEDAKSFSRYLHGAVSQPLMVEEKVTFSVTIPILWQNEDGTIIQPGAFFLTNADLLFWYLAAPLTQRRIRDTLRRKYGPKTED